MAIHQAKSHSTAVEPQNAAALKNRGDTFRRLGRNDEALASYEAALAIAPRNVEVLVAYGNALYAMRRFGTALAAYDRALAVRSNLGPVLSNRGNALRELGRKQDALESFDLALAHMPDSAPVLNNRGNALLDLNRVDEALASFDAALARSPNYPDALVNRGNALRALNRAGEALASFERAIAISPALAEAHWNKALLCLSLGNFEAGWRGYEWRWRRAGATARDFVQPQWRGGPLGGKTILLHAEQGFGDAIQFLRYVPMVVQRGAKIVLELPDSLMPLLGDIDGVIAVASRGQELPPFDLQCTLLSLPLAFGTTLATVPPPAPFLRAPANRIAKWRARLPHSEARRVGIVWSGKPTHNNDHNRSIALDRLAPLVSMPGVEFVSLQREYRDADRPELAKLPALLRLEDELADFADTAAVIAGLDLVIAVDTAVAHLAGALGKPVWILLPQVLDWRWMLDREDSPWYPTARLFRQPAIGDWDSVIARLRHELAAVAQTHAPAAQ